MRYIKRFEIINEDLRKDREYYYIDGMGEETHIIFPVIDKLNSGLQENIDALLNSMYDSCEYLSQLFWKKDMSEKNLKEIELVQGFIQILQYRHEDGELNDSEIEKFIHDIIIDGKIPVKLTAGGDNFGYDFDRDYRVDDDENF